MPHSWKKGSPVLPHIHFQTEDSNAGNMVLKFGYQVASINGDFSGSWTEETVTVPAGGNLNKHLIKAFSAIDMSNQGLSAMIKWQFQRLGNNASDTYAAQLRLLEVDFHYEIDSVGSGQEYVK